MAAEHPQHRWLEELYDRYHDPRYVGYDPLAFCERWPDVRQREVGALLAALLAFGHVKSIMAGIEDLLQRMGPEPRRFLDESSPRAIAGACRGFRYRWVSDQHLAALLVGLKRVTAEHGSLAAAFGDSGGGLVTDHLDRWVERIVAASGDALTMLLPRPSRHSACKRLCLYLRWMVRRDAVDPGGWTCFSADQLVVPLDTHLFAMAQRLGWTARRQANLATALKVTAALRVIRPDDPLRYDFALTRPGIRRQPLPIAPPAVRLSGSDNPPRGVCTHDRCYPY